jgi:hypothetical protein
MREVRKINMKRTRILSIFLAMGIKNYATLSIAALGDVLSSRNCHPRSCRMESEKHSDYAISKYGAEMEVWRGQQEGLMLLCKSGVIIGPDFLTKVVAPL